MTTKERIEHELETDLNRGVAIYESFTDKLIIPYSNREKLLKRGYNSLDHCLAALKEKGYKKVSVFLKKKNGSSSEYIEENEKYVLVVLELHDTPKKHAAVNETASQATGHPVAPAVSQHQTTMNNQQSYYPPNYQQPPQPAVIGNDPSLGLNGLNAVQFGELLADRSRLVEKIKSYDKLNEKYEKLKENYDTLKEAFGDQKLELKIKDRKPLIDKETLSGFSKMLTQFLTKGAVPVQALNGATQVDEPQFPPVKGQLIQILQNYEIAEEVCSVLINVLSLQENEQFTAEFFDVYSKYINQQN